MKPEELFRQLVVTIANEFDESDLTYTCAAIPMKFARSRIIPHMENEPYRDYRTHRLFTFRKIEKAVADEVHRRHLA